MQSRWVAALAPLTDTKNGKRYSFCVPILFRNTAYPIEKSIKGRTSRDFQKKVHIRFFEGEHTMPEKNKLLGKMVIDGLNSSVKGGEMVNIFVKIDENGILSAKVIDE